MIRLIVKLAFDDNCGCVWIDEVEASLLELEAYIRRTEEAQKGE